MFHTFCSQEERKNFGGSDFLEMQFCRMPPNTEIERMVAADRIKHWCQDSLYISGDDAGVFFQEYDGIFDCGICSNSETGAIAPYGINYYRADLMDAIIAKILKKRPADYETLTAWLYTAKTHHGFYILGV